MKKFEKFETAKVRTGAAFETLPKGAYVIKINAAKEEPNKNGTGSHIKVAFDIAEGEYAGFYKKQFDAMTGEDKRWPYDAVHNLVCPDDDSPQWMMDTFKTFIAALEDSNSGYHFDWDETKWKGLVVGALFRIEQSENNGNIYDHTRPFWFRPAQDVRDGKYGNLPKDKIVQQAQGSGVQSSDDYVPIADGVYKEIPF